MHLHHLAIQVRDLEGTARWYREILELPLLREWRDDAGAMRSVWLGLSGEAFLALERGDGRPRERGDGRLRNEGDQAEGGQAGYHLAALRIHPSERQHWEQRLGERGVAIEHRTRWTVYFRDPEGNRIGLSHHPDE